MVLQPTNVIAIFDIGKTNKKFFLLDKSYEIFMETSLAFAEITDEEGESCDDIHQLTSWMQETLQHVMSDPAINVVAVNFSAYGASLVYIDETGKPIAPLYNYLKKYPERLSSTLYAKYGGEQLISRETASPVLGSLNSGMQLYRIKEDKPLLFAASMFALHLPQYLSFVLSAHACSDITSIGCHTQLWHFAKREYHRWVTEEGLDKKLAPLQSALKAPAYNYNGRSVRVGTGLHDSSAALIPYLAVFREPFILISTGTWCISLNPFNNTPLTDAELASDCLCYMGYEGKPVKASRLFAGYEHEVQSKRLAQHFGEPTDEYKRVHYDAEIIEKLYAVRKSGTDAREASALMKDSGFESRDLAGFDNYSSAYHCLILDIIEQQYRSTQLVLKDSKVGRIFVDGGFSNNSIYMHLLALMFPDLEVYAASVAQATAMGAALAIHDEWNTEPVPSDMVKLKYYNVPGRTAINR